MQIQQPSPPDPHLHLCDRKVNMLEWMPKQAMATPSRWLPRSASARSDAPSPFSSNPAHQPVSTPSAAAPASSFGCMTATPTDTPPTTPRDVNKPKAAPAALSAAAFAAFWSPRRLMQHAARAFRSSRSRRRMKFDGHDEPPAVTSRVSDAASAGSMDVEHGSNDGNNNGSAADDRMHEEEEQQHIEIVPEKIIHVTSHHAPPFVKEAEACETEKTEAEACTEKTEVNEKENSAADEEDPKKAGAVEAAADNADIADKFCMVVKEAMMKKHDEEAAEDTKKDPMKADAVETAADNAIDMADKFCTVVKEAMKKKHDEEVADDTKEDAMRRFRGRQVKTAMEVRAESEQPRRREVARSNELIEEACTKLLAKRQGSRVRALVGAFETIMDPKPGATAAGKPQHRYRRQSV